MTAFDLITDEGFLREFYALLSQASREGRKMTQEEAFLELDELYFRTLGIHRYKSFDAFRKRRDRKLRKSL